MSPILTSRVSAEEPPWSGRPRALTAEEVRALEAAPPTTGRVAWAVARLDVALGHDNDSMITAAVGGLHRHHLRIARQDPRWPRVVERLQGRIAAMGDRWTPLAEALSELGAREFDLRLPRRRLRRWIRRTHDEAALREFIDWPFPGPARLVAREAPRLTPGLVARLLGQDAALAPVIVRGRGLDAEGRRQLLDRCIEERVARSVRPETLGALIERDGALGEIVELEVRRRWAQAETPARFGAVVLLAMTPALSPGLWRRILADCRDPAHPWPGAVRQLLSSEQLPRTVAVGLLPTATGRERRLLARQRRLLADVAIRRRVAADFAARPTPALAARLAVTGSDAVAAAALDYLAHHDHERAVRLLGRVRDGTPVAATTLQRLLQHPEREVRTAVARHVGRLGGRGG